MRNLKKLLAVIVTLVMVVTLSIPAFAADTATTATAAPTADAICKDLGMIQGTGAGVTTEYLATEVSRLQGAIMFLRLKGLEGAAKAFLGTDNFTDVKGLNADNTAILAYLKANPDLGYGGMADGSFAPNQLMTAKEYTKVLLVALGYKYGTDATADFKWENVFSFAASKGLSKLIDVDKLTINDVAVGTVEALKVTPKGGTKSLIATLVDAGTIAADKAIATGLFTAPAATFAVTSVTAINAKQIQVVFDNAVNSDTVVAANFKVYDNGSATAAAATPALQSDNKTVILTLDNDVAFTNASKAKVDVTADVKSAAGVALTAYSNAAVAVQDSTLPTVVKMQAAGLKTFKIFFSEPVFDGNSTIGNDQITVKSGIYNYIVNSVKSDYAGYALTVTVGTNIIEGPVNLTINAKGMTDLGAIRDFAGLVAMKADYSFTFAKDATVATATIDSVNQFGKTLKLKFSKLVYGTNVKIYHSINGAGAYAATTPNTTEATATDTMTFTFANELPAGSLTFYLVNDPDVAANQLTDLYGIKVANQSFTFSVVADTVAPTVSDITVNTNKSFDVKFSEDVKAAEAVKAANFSVAKPDGTKVSFTAALKPATTDTVRLTMNADLSDNTSYTVNVLAMQDTAGNAMASAFSKVIAVGDNVNPTVASQYLVGNDTIYIVYSEPMTQADITNKAMYAVDNDNTVVAYSTLGDDDSITLVSDKKVKIYVKAANLVTGKTNVVVGAVKDLAGKKLVSDSTFSTELANLAVTGLALEKAELIAKNKVKLTFSKEIGSFDNVEFKFGNAAINDLDKVYAIQSIESNVLNSDGKSEVTVVLDNDLRTDAYDNSATPKTVRVFTVATPANTKSVEGTVLTAVDVALQDKVAPAIDHVVFVNSNKLEVYFTENLRAASIAGAGKNGFTVSGGTLDSATKSALVDNIMILAGSSNDFTVDTDVTYTAGNITDASAAYNALANATVSDALTAGAITVVNAVADNTFTVTTNYEGSALALGSVDMDAATGVQAATPAINGVTYTVAVAGGVATITASGNSTAVAAATTATFTITIDGVVKTVTMNIPAAAVAGAAGANPTVAGQ